MEIYERSQEVCQLIKEESREGEPQQQTKKPASRAQTRAGLKYGRLPSMGIVSPTGGAFRRQPTTSPSSLVSGIAEQRITFTIASANPGVHRLLAGVGNLLGPQS